MSDQPATQDWQQVLRPEAWGGELRVNLVRLVAIVLFYARHLIEWTMSARDAPIRGRYHLAVTCTVAVWALLAMVLYIRLSSRRYETWIKFVAIGGDAFMITLLCILAGGPRTALVLVYFGVIASGPLRLSMRAVYAATGAAMLGYLAVLGQYALFRIGFHRYETTPDLRIARSEEAIVLLSMLVCGLFAGQIVRQIRRMMTTRMALGTDEK